ncbi:NFACT family protein, partial [Paenibacillus xylanexedens]|uniref:NFACT family protein n=1 Tax=Paenibacillus xylanexedens TaxID=528191 RepID=UPI001642A4B7
SPTPTYPRLHFTQNTFLNPTQPPIFSILLPNHSEPPIIHHIPHIPIQPIIHINLPQPHQLPHLSLKPIIIQLIPPHTNIIFLHPLTPTILHPIHHLTPSITTYP